jgi:hypothetical protein
LIFYLTTQRFIFYINQSSTTTVQNWTPRRSRTQEVCDFIDTSSGHAHKQRYQPTINLTWNQLRINLAFCVQSFGLWKQNRLCYEFLPYSVWSREIGHKPLKPCRGFWLGLPDTSENSKRKGSTQKRLSAVIPYLGPVS